VLSTQLMHACSTGSLVIFSPPGVSASQEAFWYAVYAAALWLVIDLSGFILRSTRSSPLLLRPL
jgi:hypothetical protein